MCTSQGWRWRQWVGSLRKAIGRTPLLVMAAMAMLLLAAMPQRAVAQTITNPGYETGSESGWVSGGASHGVSAAALHTGSYGLYNNGGWNSVFQNVSGFSTNTAYTVKVWARLSSAVAGNNQSIFISQDNGTTKTRQWVTSTTWTQFTFNFTTGSNTSVQMGSEEVNGSSAVAYIDDWTVTAGGSAPAAPTSLSATAGNAQASLTWTGSTGATSYNVKRSTTSGSGYANVATGVTTTSYTNTGLTNGTTYYYVVSAVNANGESGNSNQASATPSGGTAVTLNNPGFETGTLSGWMGGGSSQGVSTTNTHSGTYKAYNNGAWNSIMQNVTVTPSTSYTFTAWGRLATAVSGNNQSFYVSQDNGATKTRVWITGTTYTQYTINFTTGSGVTTVQIGNEEVNGSSAIAYIDDFALTANGGGGGSAPAAPTGLTATAGNSQISLTWNASSGATSYNLYRGTSSNGEGATPLITGITTTSYTNTGLTNGTTYYYKVAAVNSYGTSPQSTEASAMPQAPLSGRYQLGIGLGAPLDYEQDLTFADATKVAREIYSNSGTYDANGWPTGDGNIGFWFGAASNIPTTGTYLLKYDGRATVTVGLGSATVSAETYDSATDTSTRTVTISSAQGDFKLNFTGTTRGVRNVKFMRPIAAGSSTYHAATELWYRPMKDLVSRFQWIRFMDFTATNGNAQVNWSERTKPTRWSQQYYPKDAQGNQLDWWQGRGAAWEYAIMLCNETGKDLWINVPTKASDDYILKLAQTICYGSNGDLPYTSTQASPVYPPLNSSLKVYIEYSNEIWNFGFPQWGQVQAMATATASNHPIRFDGTTDSGTLTKRYWANRIVNISSTFRSVFGDSAMMTRVRPLFESQLTWADNYLSGGLWFIDAWYNNGNGNHVATPHPVSYYIYGGGGSTYPLVPDTQANSGSVDQVIAGLQTGQYPAWDNAHQRDIDYLKGFGLKRIGYEGGTGIDGTGTGDQAKLDAQKDSRITAAYVNEVSHYIQDGGDMWTNFLGANVTHGIYQTYDTANLNTYKRQAIDQLNAGTPPAVTYGVLLPATIYGGRYRACSDQYSTGGSDSGVTCGTGAWFNYIVRNTSNQTFTVRLNTSGSGSATIYVDGTAAGTVTVVNGGDTTSVSATLAPGQHGIQVHNATGSWTLNQVKVQ